MMHTPDARILICLGPCHGEFYLPLTLDEAITCPNDATHPVALYQNPGIHAGQPDWTDEDYDRADGHA